MGFQAFCLFRFSFRQNWTNVTLGVVNPPFCVTSPQALHKSTEVPWHGHLSLPQCSEDAAFSSTMWSCAALASMGGEKRLKK